MYCTDGMQPALTFEVTQLQRSRLRAALDAGTPVFGTWIQTPSPEVAEILGEAGFDFVIIDLEHGYFGTESAANLIRAAELGGAGALVRVPQEAAEQIGKALDLGAGGVVIPGVANREEGERFISRTRFGPKGTRGASISTRELRYARLPLSQALEGPPPIVVLQVEAALARERLAEILDLEGLDILFIGPFDLSVALGVPGELDHPALLEEMARICTEAAAHHVAVGLWCSDATSVERWLKLGVRFFTVSNNELLLFRASHKLVGELRNVAGLHAEP
jgi:4-hydroxy-2-oxoheptanedioate aldolase